MKFILKNLSLILIFLFVGSCGGSGSLFPDAKKTPTNAEDRVKKNLAEGRGLRFTMKNGDGGTNFSFASSNPLWRATLEKLDFIPLQNVDYAGGVIVTDWYSLDNGQTRIKINIRVIDQEMTNESLAVTLFTQSLDGDRWIDQGISSEQSLKIKESILSSARSLKIASEL